MCLHLCQLHFLTKNALYRNPECGSDLEHKDRMLISEEQEQNVTKCYQLFPILNRNNSVLPIKHRLGFLNMI